MDAQYFLALHKEQFERFLAQDPDNGEFDVVFDIGGKKLYANKYKLCPISPTFKSWLSERWSTPNEPIKIKDYTFDDFKEFITFIYSGGCKLTDKNIASMVDMAEFYQVGIFKKKCEDFLSTIVLDHKNIFPLLELVYKYSLEDFTESLLFCASNNFLTFIQQERFQELPQEAVYDFVKLNENTLRQEEFFEMVYKWAENQASKKTINNQKLNEIIKDKFFSILKYFKFYMMKNEFLLKFVVSKSFLFTGPELSDILWSAQYTVILIDKNGKMMKGVLNCQNDEGMCKHVQSLKYAFSDVHKPNHWEITCPRFVLPISSYRNYCIYKGQWYLVHTHHSEPVSTGSRRPVTKYYLTVKHRNQLVTPDVVLAEMIEEDGFQLDSAKFV